MPSANSVGKPIITITADHKDGKGNLIARSVDIQPPEQPDCFRFSCLWRFYRKVVLCWLLSIYHCRRVVYAEKNRHKKIPEKYRTGGDAPETVKGLIWGIIKLKLRR